MKPNHDIDWPRVLSEIAWVLGEPDAPNTERRVPCSQPTLALYLHTPRTTLRGWIDGSEPKHADGERIIEAWCLLTAKSRVFVPMQRASLSAARAR